MVDVEIYFGLMVFGKVTFADEPRFVCRAFGYEDNYLAEFLVGTLADDVWCTHERP